MIITVSDDFDLRKIAESGQCFRWRNKGDGYSILYGSRILEIYSVVNVPGEFNISCTPDEWEYFWAEYFDLQTRYSMIRSRIDKAKDPYLHAASEAGRGIRILRQDPWEVLVTFIISQRKSIPAIRTCVEKLCKAAGEKICAALEEEDYYAFPDAGTITDLSDQQLSDCGLGYRVKYVKETSRLVSAHRVDLNAMSMLDDRSLYQELMSLPGVGTKVANCVMLFGFHRLNCFPEDVWIKRVLQENYTEGFPFDQYVPYCGVMQQYLFYYRRQKRDDE